MSAEIIIQVKTPKSMIDKISKLTLLTSPYL